MTNTSTSTIPFAPARRWTIRDALAESRPPSRSLILLAGAIALLCTLDPGIPLAAGVTTAALVPAVLVDLLDRRLPNRLLAMAALSGGAVGVISLVMGDAISPADSVVGALSMAGPLVVAHVVSPASMGFGDVKAALVLGAAVGLVDPILGLGALAVASAGTAIIGVVARRRTLAFGPGLFGGAVAVLILIATSAVQV